MQIKRQRINLGLHKRLCKWTEYKRTRQTKLANKLIGVESCSSRSRSDPPKRPDSSGEQSSCAILYMLPENAENEILESNKTQPMKRFGSWWQAYWNYKITDQITDIVSKH